VFGSAEFTLFIYRRFMQALKAQGISRDELPYKAPYQPYGNYFALISTGIIAFFKGFDTFIPWNKSQFTRLLSLSSPRWSEIL
jgi:yeast amino acid transporter